MAVGAAAIALVTYEALAHHGQTNSGTQPYVRHETGEIMRHEQHDHTEEHGEHH